jgi:hypothetical protein
MCRSRLAPSVPHGSAHARAQTRASPLTLLDSAELAARVLSLNWNRFTILDCPATAGRDRRLYVGESSTPGSFGPSVLTVKGDGLRAGALLVLITAFCGVGVVEAVVRRAGWTIGSSGALRLLPKVLEHAGAIMVALVAYAVPARRLSRVLAAFCVLLLGALAAYGGTAGPWSLPLSVLIGALDVCVWALLLNGLLGLDSRLAAAALLLTVIASNITQLFFSGLGSGLGVTAALHLVGACASALVLGLSFAFRPQPSEIGAPDGETIPGRRIALLCASSFVIKLASSAMSLARLPHDLGKAAVLALEIAAMLLGPLCLLAVSAWLAFRQKPTRALMLAGASIFIGATLTTGYLVSGAWFSAVASLGRGLVNAAATLLLFSAATLVPSRHLPLLLAVWFLPNFVAGRLSDAAFDWSREGAGRPFLVTTAGIVLTLVSAVSLLKSELKAQRAGHRPAVQVGPRPTSRDRGAHQ